MDRRGRGNGCVLRIAGALACAAFAVSAAAAVFHQGYARVVAYTAPIPASESAFIVNGMNGLLVVFAAGFCVLAWCAWKWR